MIDIHRRDISINSRRESMKPLPFGQVPSNIKARPFAAGLLRMSHFQ